MPLRKFTLGEVGLLRMIFISAGLSGQLILSAHACLTDCAIDVSFTGKYTEETCEVLVNNGSNNGVVTLPQISTNSLKNNASEAGSTPFDIALKNCPANRSVTLFFNSRLSSFDSTTGNLINNTIDKTYSLNVQIRVRKEDGSQVFIDNSSTGQTYLIPATAETISHRFAASYYALGDSAVTAGKVQTIAGVELDYK